MNITTRKIFLLISFLILATIGLQVYWNYKNYISNKDRLFNEVQIAYDKALEIYFNEESKKQLISFVSSDKNLKSKDFINLVFKDSIFKSAIKTNSPKTKETDTLLFETFNDNSTKIDTKIFFIDGKTPLLPKSSSINSIQVLKGKIAQDKIGGIEQFPNRIVINMSSDTIKYNHVDSILKTELKRKNIALDYSFYHLKKDSLFYTFLNSNQTFKHKIEPKSTFFKPDEILTLGFNYSNLLLLKRMGIELVLSFIFLIGLIGCLFFMLYVISKQKKMDDIKNDFINNITHEFKTPITTISSALEGMSNFNPTNNLEKNQKYISISKKQLSKLEIMVEKILETATLNTEKLTLNRERFNLIPFLNSIVEKHKTSTNKSILLSNYLEQLLFFGDPFYLENVFSNLIDNAIKYGGDEIIVTCELINNTIQIDVTDTGNTIPKSEEKSIFEKFYRIPKGNLHDVKGYGIGLYFSKTLIEKHNGSLQLIRNHQTTFRIILPYE
ncbi:HAMP domain-containing histidine kinase [Flavobacterium jejuense]|uniref:histidine kinase n=1 Tax=Flavobacterium jejuense TaxID=1544455 RepID=A0ABX0IVZ1_9FLAO|nr:HAMP domain-containing sensor histidine kinase [Flavobacterium jejuense]NHN27633.1 HAMP domain-containing histidine kinase [Flavobacterium jejuense]